MAQCKNFMQVSSKVAQIVNDAYLHHLDLSNTVMNFTACKLLANLVRSTQRLEDLNLSNCTLRATSARELADALLFNQSLKFLNLSLNSFASKDYELSSKLARLVQVHGSLVHLDLSSVQLRREEAMYVAQCLADSSNLVSCHLTGNQVDYYSRLYLRAHLKAIVQYPLTNTLPQQSQLNAADRTQVIGLNKNIQDGLDEGDGLALYEARGHGGDEEYFADMMAEADEDDDRRYAELRKAQREEEAAARLKDQASANRTETN